MRFSFNRYASAVAASIVMIAVLAAAAQAAETLDCADVATAYGKVTGKPLSRDEVCEFRGIPYAAPPVGDLRFAMPQPPQAWEGSLDALEFSKECVQYPLLSLIGGGGEVIGSEDCLYLNIWQPFSTAAGPKPVMVFIHGGGFVTGTANTGFYNGSKLAKRGDVVVVTLNYRLGALGFFSHPTLKDGKGNYGIHDQIAALKWVNENIKNFGGDPENVTIFGESAGGMSVGIQAITPLSEGLFHRAILQSGPLTFLGKTLEAADADGLEIAEVLGCGGAADQLACLRAVSAFEFHEKTNPSMYVEGTVDIVDGSGKDTKSFKFAPVVDGELIPAPPMQMLSEGRYNKSVKQIIVGANKDETSYFTLGKKVDTPEELEAELAKDAAGIAKRLGIDSDISKLKELYPLEDYESPRKVYNEIAGDMAMTCPSLVIAKRFAAAGPDTYLYNFARSPVEKGLGKDWGAFHGAELPFIFEQFTFFGIKFWSKNNVAMSNDMIEMWSSFAYTGVPAAEGVPAWPKFDPATGEYMVLDLKSEVRSNFKPAQCGYFETLF